MDGQPANLKGELMTAEGFYFDGKTSEALLETLQAADQLLRRIIVPKGKFDSQWCSTGEGQWIAPYPAK
jgi:hypothetical protein